MLVSRRFSPSQYLLPLVIVASLRGTTQELQQLLLLVLELPQQTLLRFQRLLSTQLLC